MSKPSKAPNIVAHDHARKVLPQQRLLTTIADSGREALASFTLSEPMDMVLLDDRRVMHGVTPIRALDPTLTGHRDVLVLTFRR